jgi:hypothetical protein
MIVALWTPKATAAGKTCVPLPDVFNPIASANANFQMLTQSGCPVYCELLSPLEDLVLNGERGEWSP